MTIFDLVFIVVFLACAGTALTAVASAVRGNRGRARVLLGRLAAAVALYVAIVAVVSLASPQRFVALGTDQCSDDWCIAADSVRRERSGDTIGYAVHLRLTSRAKRVAQRERFVVVYLRDARGRRFDAEPDASAVPFDTLLQPGETVQASRRFSVPATAKDVGLVVAREGGFRFPGCCIVGDEGSLLHKRTIVRLE
jgi:hypothetical protein